MGPCFLTSERTPEDAADPGGAVVLMDVVADGGDRRPGPLARREQGTCLGRGARRPVGVVDLMPAARRPEMLAEQLASLRVQHPDGRPVPLDVDAPTDPPGRDAVEGGLDLNAPIEVDGPDAVLVVAERLERQGAECGPLLGKHRRDLALGRPVDAGIGPAVQIGLGRVERLEAQTLQGRLLRVTDAGFDLALAIGIPNPTGQGDDAVVSEHVAVARVERRIVDVRGEDAFLQVVEDDDAHRAAQPAERPLVERGPDPGTRAPDEQPDRLAGRAQRQDEEPRAAVLAGVGVADHRALAVIDVALLPPSRRDDDPGFDGGPVTQRGQEAADTGVAPRKPLVVDQVLPDGHGVAPAAQRLDHQLAIRLAGARPRRSARRGEAQVGGHLRRGGRFWERRVGGHPRRGGRFWRPVARPAAPPAHRDRGGLQIAAGRLPADARRRFDASQRPAESPQRQDLLSCVFAQDVAHAA